MAQQKEGQQMSVSAVIFIVGVVMIVASIWIYSKAEDTAYDKLLAKYNEVSGTLKELQGLVNSNISTAGSANVNAKAAKEEVEKKLAEFRTELDVFRDQCADTREKQIQLRDALSRRRPQINIPTGPIIFEIHETRKPAQPKPATPTTKPAPTDTKKKPLGKGIKAVMENK